MIYQFGAFELDPASGELRKAGRVVPLEPQPARTLALLLARAGDVVSREGWPVVDWTTGGWIGGIVGGLQRLSTLIDADTRIVPGRGSVLGAADLKTQYEMYQTIYDRLTQLLNKGRGPGEAVAAGPAKEFEAQMGNPDEFVRRAFESLWAYLSPDA